MGNIIERMSALSDLSESDVKQKIDDIRHLRVNPADDPEFMDVAKQAYKEIAPVSLARMEFDKSRLGLDGDQAANFIGRKIVKGLDDIDKLQDMREEFIASQEQAAPDLPDASVAVTQPEAEVSYAGPTEMLQDPAMADRIKAAMDDVATQMDGRGVTAGDLILYSYNGEMSSAAEVVEAADLNIDQVDNILADALRAQGVPEDQIDMARTAMARIDYEGVPENGVSTNNLSAQGAENTSQQWADAREQYLDDLGNGDIHTGLAVDELDVPAEDELDEFEAFKQQTADEFAAFEAESQAEFEAFKGSMNATERQPIENEVQQPQISVKGMDM
jgi:hypothetical protein